MEGRRTINYFQWIRACGAVAIVLLHAFVTLHIAGEGSLSPVRVGIEEALSITLTRWAVPAFFMVSGALMLDPSRTMGWDKILRHVWRLVFVLLTFGLAFALVESISNQHFVVDAQGIIDGFHRLLSEDSWDHMWFVYELIGYYLMTPFIRPWVAQVSREEYGRVLLWMFVVMMGTSAISSFLPYRMYYGVAIPECFCYYLLGYYAMRYLELDRRWLCAGAVSLVAMLVLVIALDQTGASAPICGVVAPYAIMVFLAFKRYLDIPTEGHPLVALFADYSFGIYLIHPVFQHLMVMVPAIVGAPALLADVALTVVPLALSLVSVWLLRFIPGFRGKI